MNRRPHTLTVYTPEASSGGLWHTALQTVREVKRARFVILRLFIRDFKAQYQQNALGYFWAFLNPLLGIASFLFLNYGGILHPGDVKVPYPLYLFVGVTTWSLLVTAVTAVGSGLRGQSELILRTNIPKIALVAASFATIVYTMLVNLILLTLIFVAFHTLPSWHAIVFPLLIIPLVLLGIGVGLAASVIGIIARDFPTFVTQLLGILMYFTPIIYASGSVQQPILRTAILVNPLTYLIDVPRAVLLDLHTDYWPQYACASVFALVVLLVGIKIFYLVEDLVAERL